MKLFGFKICPSVEFLDILVQIKEITPSRLGRETINIREKPEWYSKLVPTGKVPALECDSGVILFEATVIAKYLDGMPEFGKQIHPVDLELGALNSAWMSWCDNLLMDGYLMSLAKTKSEFELKQDSIKVHLEKLEPFVKGPFFNGNMISLIDCKYSSLFKRFNQIHEIFDIPCLTTDFPKIHRWASLLLESPKIQAGFNSDFDKEFIEMLEFKKASYLLSLKLS